MTLQHSKTDNFENVRQHVINNIKKILHHFNIKYTIENETLLRMCCPIHKGDNPRAIGICTEKIGSWKCYTKNCHEDYSSGIISFVQALLSVTHDKEYSFVEAVKWCENFTQSHNNNIINVENIDKDNIVEILKIITKGVQPLSHICTKSTSINGLQIPAQYYIDRGYSKEILCKYNVGLCINKTKSIYNRVVVPCYDDSGEYCVGYISRTTFEKCPICNDYHNPQISECVRNDDNKKRTPKWKMNVGFRSQSYLYNYWNAKKYILKTDTVILVEGAGDVWRLEEAGIHNSVALFGIKFTEDQQEILGNSALRIILATDLDEAGIKIRGRIKKQCNHMFTIKELDLPKKDIGDMTIDEIHSLNLS